MQAECQRDGSWHGEASICLVGNGRPSTICKESASDPGGSDAGAEVGCETVIANSMSTISEAESDTVRASSTSCFPFDAMRDRKLAFCIPRQGCGHG